MEEKDINAIDQILDPENCDPIVLYDEDGEKTEFDQVALIPLDDAVYVILAPITPIEGVGEDEGIVFVIEETDDEEMLTVVTDDEIVDRVFEEYFKLVEEEDAE